MRESTVENVWHIKTTNIFCIIVTVSHAHPQTMVAREWGEVLGIGLAWAGAISGPTTVD